MTEYKPLQTVAYDRLKNMIQNRELAFDIIYSETKLAAEFSISRTPMRDALTRLSNERYIDILPNRGFIMHRPSPSDILEAYHMRMALEGHCAQVVANDHLLPKGKATIERMKQCLEKQIDVNATIDLNTLQDFWQCDLDFHSCLISYLNVASFYQEFETFMHFFTAHCVHDYINLNRNISTLVEHQRIIDALSFGDAQSALEAMRYHLDKTLEITLKDIRG